MFSWLAAKYKQWKINSYLKQRQKDVPHAVALRKAWLTPEQALDILHHALNHNLSSVGIVAFRPGGGFTSDMDQDQLTTVMVALADLIPALPQDKQNEVEEELNQLANHSWGYVRGAACAALKTLAPH